MSYTGTVRVFVHRVNTLEKLLLVPRHFGVEVDVRGLGEKVVLSHEPISESGIYIELSEFLMTYVKRGISGGIIFNIKESGYESVVIELAKQYGIADYFLLDVEFPYLYNATREQGIKNIAIRYSEAEPIEMVEAQMIDGEPLLDWVWIDTNTTLPLNLDVVARLAKFKTCLVCPERWGRAQDIPLYIETMRGLNFKPTAVMTSLKEAYQWEKAAW